MQIYDHDSPESINYKNSSIELEDWIEHINYIEKEISSLLKLIKTDHLQSEDFQTKLTSLELNRESNINILDELMKYRNTLPNAAECEDVECDMFYVNEYMRYRKLYRDHLESYRRIKEEFFQLLSK